VGQTEKNIVRAFREAKAAEAVLFWDEADAMFYDRDATRYNWEVRDVNVLLQSLEHFEGVCILATNRKLAMDPAFQRRISLKVDFPRPDQSQRRQIWQRLLPDRMPLSTDVDLERLSQEDLVGGEIKNAVLNAARLAVLHGSAQVAWAHFQEALAMERDGAWTAQGRNRIGFGSDWQSAK
jgi:SpoVK/Ycf46/Vps4 family AAA+-type ATPase